MVLLIGLLLIFQGFTPTLQADPVKLAEDITVENFMAMKNATPVYLPANRMDQRGHIYYNQQPRLFKITQTMFGITFNPLRCFPQGYNDVHRVVLSFMDDWRDGVEIKPKHIFKNAYVIHRNIEYSMDVNYLERHDPLHSWDYYYTINRYINGSKFPGVVHGMKMNILNLEITVRIGEKQSIMAFINGRDETKGLQDTIFYPVVMPMPKNARYFAVFASEQESCPAFISNIDDKFPVWSTHKRITVTGLIVKPREPTSVLRDLFIAVCACTVYAWLLINYMAPFVLNKIYPERKSTIKNKHD